MSDSRFSAPPPSSQPAGGDPFGYFATAPARAPSNPFGGPAAPAPAPVAAPTGPPPANPFGAPAPAAPVSPFGQPGYGQPSYPPSRRRGGSSGKRIGTAVGVLALLVVAWFGWNMYQRARPITLPATLAGQSENNTLEMLKVRDTVVAEMSRGNPGFSVAAKVYGTGTIVLAARGHEDVLDDFRSQPDMAAPVQVGKSLCAADRTGAVVECIRSETHLTVGVVQRGNDLAAASALVDVVWTQL